MATLESRTVRTARLASNVWIAGDPKHPPVVLIHGNVSSAEFFDRVQTELEDRFFVIAPDLRGYGKSETKPVDATRGMRDYAEDIVALLSSGVLGFADDAKFRLLGWSAGANVVMQLAIDHPDRVHSLVLINPGSPYGFGGTKGVDGQPCHPDFAGSGGGTANPQFVERIEAKDRGADDQIVSDRSMFDFGVLGELGVVPGWPGAEVYPAQPMVAQTRAVLDRYEAGGGAYREVVFEDCGHGPHIEKHDEFMALVTEFWT